MNAVLGVLICVLSAASTPGYWEDLAPGASAVGFSQRWVVDQTRRLPRDTLGLRHRPLLVNLWYPAVADEGERMPYGDYFDGAVRAAGDDPALGAYARALVAHHRDIAWRELGRGVPDSTEALLERRVGTLYASPSAAYRNASRPSGRLPVVVYTQGAQSSYDDNVVLCEYLASRGYLVVGSAFPREDDGDFGTSASDESRQRDIRRLLLEVSTIPGIELGRVTVVGHSAGAQVMQRFAADPNAPIDAVISLDTTQDYAMLSDRTWAYYTDPLMEHRRNVRIPMMFVAAPQALFELADSLSSCDRWLVTVPDLRHSEFISQGGIRRQLAGDLTEADPASGEGARSAYAALVRYIGAWLDAREGVDDDGSPRAPHGIEVVAVERGRRTPEIDSGAPRTAREARHLFGTATPEAFAAAFVRARAADRPAGSDTVLMMLLVDAVRKDEGERARTVYREALARDSSVARVRDAIASRAELFERIQDAPLAREWWGFLNALDGSRDR